MPSRKSINDRLIINKTDDQTLKRCENYFQQQQCSDDKIDSKLQKKTNKRKSNRVRSTLLDNEPKSPREYIRLLILSIQSNQLYCCYRRNASFVVFPHLYYKYTYFFTINICVINDFFVVVVFSFYYYTIYYYIFKRSKIDLIYF